MSLQIEAIVDELAKIPAYGTELEGIRIRASVVDGPGFVTVPLDLELGMVPPKIGDTLRVEATWGPING